MKNKISITLVIALAIVTTLFGQSSAFSGEESGNSQSVMAIPDTLPIGSVDDLVTASWEAVRFIGVGAGASSAVWAKPDQVSSVQLVYEPTNGVVDVDEIYTIIRSQQMELSVLCTNDQVSVGCGLYDKDWEWLFSGGTSTPLAPPVNGVSVNNIGVVLNMNERPMIPFPDARWFYIVERDTNGNPVRYYSSEEWDVRDGNIRFPAYFAGKPGEIVITRPDGTQVAYRTDGSGQKIEPVVAKVSVNEVSTLGMRTFRDPLSAEVDITNAELFADANPICQLVFSKKSNCYFGAYIHDPNTGDVVEYAVDVRVWKKGEPSSTAKVYHPYPDSGVWVVGIQPGHYWVSYRFVSGFGNKRFSPPYQSSGGKG